MLRYKTQVHAGIIVAVICVAASDHTARGGSERVPATNQEPHLIQNGWCRGEVLMRIVMLAGVNVSGCF